MHFSLAIMNSFSGQSNLNINELNKCNVFLMLLIVNKLLFYISSSKKLQSTKSMLNDKKWLLCISMKTGKGNIIFVLNDFTLFKPLPGVLHQLFILL